MAGVFCPLSSSKFRSLSSTNPTLHLSKPHLPATAFPCSSPSLSKTCPPALHPSKAHLSSATLSRTHKANPSRIRALSQNPLEEPENPSYFCETENPSPKSSSPNNPSHDSSQNPFLQRQLVEDDHPREECGVVGIYGDPEASRLCYLALHALQHRGQEGAGIVSVNNNVLHSVTGTGLVSDVFSQSKLAQLPGSSAIGHVRYSTAGSSMLKNVQPFVAGYRFGSVGVAHNGNLVNYRTLRDTLEDQGSIFNTSSDTEVVLHLIAISKERPFFLRIVNACKQLEGAYSMVFITEDKLVAVRDPHGFRPLVMGRRENGAVVFASETCALDLIEAKYEREVNPGEVIIVDNAEGVSSLCLLPHREPKPCVFEHIYFSLPNSVVFGKSVYKSRYTIGQILAKEAPVECDVVIAVPDSGVVAALGYAAMAGVPFQQGLIRSHYVGRTFIEPSQRIRDFGVKLKLAPVRDVLEGKRVVVVDDSIVRGTTSSKIVRLIKEAGAKEVHMRIASPPIIGSCFYGVDTPSPDELISNKMNVEKVREFIGSDSLAFLPLESLKKFMGGSEFCYACFSGDYPVPPRDVKIKHLGDFVDDGLSGKVDEGWTHAPSN
ncbi:hypothetical protein AMTRI_Chr05g65160 [Amborella trichopoda]|uniref:amidophosphoribosyltransferase n=1 Tax=Amborella trichopoda TaxID=13333 RepID=W1P8B0_AMBTC|nr:amidophosphoribosyltransferase, chloroplastic [Amborella trichopoda]XP_020521512.1 amidophosphoribosyltransferase, chloroplastic [Amborella trichopoda]ERN03836.1 hypothetical protein AMTR_s00078p00141340 [Amborella trichopoda]|eukprot:XP_020521511.1 amidophosphoribosyltransferase, chloroplastic [Amborella trichopoda]